MNAVILASSTATRVGQLVRMLGSDKPGEVVAAASAIKRTLNSAGMDFHHLADAAVQALQRPPLPPPPPPPPQPLSFAQVIRFCAARNAELNDRESQFIWSLDGQVLRFGEQFEPSERQRGWLAAIYVKLRSNP